MAALVAIALASVLAGCPPSDVPESFGLRFKNDLGRRVALKLCDDDDCHDFDYTDWLRAGSSLEENMSPDYVLTRWAVTDAKGRRLGCLPIEFGDVSYANVVVRLSQMVPCPGHQPLKVQHGRKTSGVAKAHDVHDSGSMN